MPAGPQTGLPMTYMHQGRQYCARARGPQGGGAQLWPGDCSSGSCKAVVIGRARRPWSTAPVGSERGLKPRLHYGIRFVPIFGITFRPNVVAGFSPHSSEC